MADWRKQVERLGADTFTLHEMERLGFWSAQDEQVNNEQIPQARERLKELEEELGRLRKELNEIRDALQESQEIDRLVAEIRRARILRVQARRGIRRVEKAAEKSARRKEFESRKSRTPFYLGPDVSAGLRFDDKSNPRLAELDLPVLRNAEDIATQIGIDARKLQWLCFDRKVSKVDHYNRFQIPKRNGGMRPISSPKPRMRKAQDWIRLNLLSKMLPHTRIATAFRPGKSIVDNAQPHAGKAVVVRIDLKDFFPSVTFWRVKGLFQYCGYNEGVATMLGLLCTESLRAKVKLDGKTFFVANGPRVLPQGACTSPDLANFICRKLDVRIDGFAKSFGFEYTRYADDLIFSHPQARANVRVLTKVVYKIVREEGFEPNLDKTAIMGKHGRQMVTGLLVNDVPRVSRHDARRFRAIAHQCRTIGYAQVSEKLGCDAKSYLKGYLSFVRMVNEDQGSQLEQLCPWDLYD
ncbi:MAG: reverse transcriptase family protein [Planctomycetaceae bacterium]